MTEPKDADRDGLAAWSKPELRRLGSIRDIAGPQAGGIPNGANPDRRS